MHVARIGILVLQEIACIKNLTCVNEALPPNIIFLA